MKATTNIIILSVLVCFVLNNLLFTYSIQKEEKMEMICIAKEDVEESCCAEEEEIEIVCCSEEGCCARIPVQSSHLNFSVIIGADKKQGTHIQVPELSNFDLAQIHHAAELSEGHLSSLIKPPAVA